MWIYVNGHFVDQDHAVIHVCDQGFLYGDGVFETIRAYHGHFFLMDRHIQRLLHSCARLGIPEPMDHSDWSALLQELLRRNHLHDGLIRITITRGVGEPGKLGSQLRTPTVVALPRSLPSLPPSSNKEGVHLTLVHIRRNAPSAIPPDIKSLNMLNNILAKREADEAGAHEGIMLTLDGHVAEGTTSNIFFIESGVLHTPALTCGILPGITREVVIQLARQMNIPVEEGLYPPERLFNAQECFLTSTGIEILPVQGIGTKRIREDNNPGTLTKRLQEAFQAKVRENLTPGNTKSRYP